MCVRITHIEMVENCWDKAKFLEEWKSVRILLIYFDCNSVTVNRSVVLKKCAPTHTHTVEVCCKNLSIF